MIIHLYKHKGSPLRTTKSIALGATLGGMIGPFLKAAMFFAEKVVEMIKLTKMRIEVSFFSNEASKLDNLNLQKG